jgi:predicted alpha/beta hydrolase family esterase
MTAIAGALDAFPEDGILAGHSLGGASLLQTMALRFPGRRVAGFVGFSMPWWGAGGWDHADFALPGDAANRLQGIGRLALYHCEDDEEVPFAHLALYGRALPGAVLHPAPGGSHLWQGADVGPVLSELRSLQAI